MIITLPNPRQVRIDRASFMRLRDVLRPLLKRTPTPMKPHPLSVGEQLWAALRFLASGAALPVIAEAVHYSTTTVHRCVRDVCLAIVTALRHQHVAWPDDNEGLMRLVRRAVERRAAQGGSRRVQRGGSNSAAAAAARRLGQRQRQRGGWGSGSGSAVAAAAGACAAAARRQRSWCVRHGSAGGACAAAARRQRGGRVRPPRPPPRHTPHPPPHPTPHTQVAAFRTFAGVPNAVGAIDGSDIRIKCPPCAGDGYINRKGFHSVKLQAVCGPDLKFLDVFVGSSGRWHDEFAFRQSPLWEQLRGTLGARLRANSIDLTLPPARAGGAPRVERVPLQLLGDSAYAVDEFLLPAFQDSTARDGPRRRFNLAHAKTRNAIERAFGVLKARWRILLRDIDFEINNTLYIIAACCILHNVCISWGVQVDDSVEREAQQLAAAAAAATQQGAAPACGARLRGDSIRTHVMTFIDSQP
jgi:hypothetical protein